MGSCRFRSNRRVQTAPDGRQVVRSSISTEEMDARLERAQRAAASGDLRAAEGLIRSIVKAAPTSPYGHLNLGGFLDRIRRWSEAEASYLRALRFSPAHSTIAARVQFSQSGLLLGAGNYSREAWRLWEQRWHVFNPKETKPTCTTPEWDGRPIPGARILILPEQGIGDQIMMARFAPWLKQQGVDVVLATKRATARLFRGLGVPTVDCGPRIGRHLEAADRWVSDMSLMPRTEVTLGTLPSAPYLPMPRPRKSLGFFGVFSHTTSASETAVDRSLSLGAASRLLSIPGAVDLRPEVTGARDFTDTAAIIAGLDLVITVDTAVAHLAGAMGKPVWVLLPWLGRDWRWLRHGTDSPWYPTARLYEQPEHLDWDGLVDQVETDLAAELGTRVRATRRFAATSQVLNAGVNASRRPFAGLGAKFDIFGP